MKDMLKKKTCVSSLSDVHTPNSALNLVLTAFKNHSWWGSGKHAVTGIKPSQPHARQASYLIYYHPDPNVHIFVVTYFIVYFC